MDTDSVEREVKLEAGIGFRVPDFVGVWSGLSAQPQPDRHLHAIYMDTPDLRLLRNGLTLRHRSDRTDGSGAWTLKLPAPPQGAGRTRREMTWPGPPGPVPAEISSLVRGYRRTAPLGPVARLVTRRQRTVLCDRSGEALLEVDDDVVSVMDGRRLAARFREVEVEVVGPAPDALLAVVVDRLHEAGAVAGDAPSKLARAIGARAGEPPDVQPAAVGSHSTIGDTVRAAIAHGYLRLLDHDLGVRLGEDPEDVHQARVATRRLRSDLRTFRAFLPSGWDQETRGELGWLAEALGRARDADVLLERLQGRVQGLEPDDARAAGALVARLVRERDEAREALLAAMDTDRYGLLLDRLVAAAHELPPLKAEDLEPATAEPEAAADPGGSVAVVVSPPSAEVEREAPARRLAAGVVTGPWRHLNQAVGALGSDPADEALHEVRIRAKRLRYACEAVAGVVGPPAVRMAKAAADLQGVLGDFHDAIVAEQWLRSASPALTVSQALAAGQLIAQEREDAQRCRSAWSKSWKRLDRKKRRAWLA